MNKWLSRFCWLVAGLVTGSFTSSLTVERFSKWMEPRREILPESRWNDDGAEDWLFGDGFTLEHIFPDPDLLAAVRNPDRMKIFRYSGEAPLIEGQGRKPSPEIEASLRRILPSANAYRSMTACGFSPAVVLRLEKAGKSWDLVFCFQCRDIHFQDAGIGMTREGAEAFLHCFGETFPEFQELNALRK